VSPAPVIGACNAVSVLHGPPNGAAHWRLWAVLNVPEACRRVGSCVSRLLQMQDLPDGVVTFLFTDVEGSTRLWEDAPESMMEALRLHDDVIAAAVETHSGIVVKPRGEGDSQFVVFRSASDAVDGAAEIQRRLHAVDWPTPRPLLVRASLHTGLAELELGDYYGTAVNRAARLRAIAHGGQTVMSGSTFEVAQDHVPDGVTITDMGLHRLKDLTRSEHVFQLYVDDLPHSFPPLKSLDAVPNNLPVQLTDFVGRRSELDDAKRVIEDARLLTILAPGGAGKTRLAIQAAADLASGFSDGVFFVALAPIESPSEIVQAVAESLGIALSTDDDLEAQLLAYLTSKSQLLVFDNFEHVAEGAGIVAEVLKSAPDVKIIVTSRSKLRISGETVMILHGMDVTWESEEEAFRAGGVRLFVNAAQRADASFSLSNDDLLPLAHILDQVGGMPLGIELAAAWVDALQVSDIADEVAKSIDFLESEAGDVPDRHRSIRAVFDYSWSLLSEDERTVFSTFSVFRGGFARDAAEAISGASVRDLANLVSKSLLVHDRELARYTVHELLRQYAADMLERTSSSSQAAKSAHMRFYASITSGAAELIPVCDHVRALHIVESDLDNIRSSWRHALATEDASAAKEMAVGLWFLHEIRGWHQAGASLFEEALDALDADSADETTRSARASASAVQAWFMALLGQPVTAVEQAREAVSTLAELSDRHAHVIAIECMCAGLLYVNELEEMRAVTTEATSIAEDLGDEWLFAEMDVWLAFAELTLGETDNAIPRLDRANEVLSRRGDLRARAWTDIGLAMTASTQGLHRDAIAMLENVVDYTKRIGYRRAIQGSLQQLGEERIHTGELESASLAFVESIAMSEQMGSIAETAEMLVRVAKVRSEMGMKDEAVTILAGVLADPASDQSAFVSTAPIRQSATELLEELRQDLDADHFERLYAAGSATGIGIATKNLLAN
jgi:predicted ATPase/class 3 adenylate cyclase